MREIMGPVQSLVSSSRQSPDADDSLNSNKKPCSTERNPANKYQESNHDIKLLTAFPIHPALPEFIQGTDGKLGQHNSR